MKQQINSSGRDRQPTLNMNVRVFAFRLGAPSGGCSCIEDYKGSSEWWKKKNMLTERIYYGEAAAYLMIAWKALVSVAEKKGYEKPIAPVCCKCGVLERIQCMKSCIEEEQKCIHGETSGYRPHFQMRRLRIQFDIHSGVYS